MRTTQGLDVEIRNDFLKFGKVDGWTVRNVTRWVEVCRPDVGDVGMGGCGWLVGWLGGAG